MTTIQTVEAETLKLALEAAGQAMFDLDPTDREMRWADPDAARDLFGLDHDINGEDDLLALLDEEFITQRQSALDAAQEANTSYSLEYRLGPDAGNRWVEERGMWMAYGDTKRLVGVIRLIDDQKQREARLSYLACYDELTGQLNRARCKELIGETLDAVRQGTRQGALLLVGIDNVGGINSDFGFDIADQVIVEVADRIAASLGQKGVFGRVAGTKFSIILNEGTAEAIVTQARTVMNAMREQVVMTRAGGIGVSVCVGATLLDSQASSSIAMAETEAAFDQARRKGPSSFEMFSETTETVSRRRQNTEMSDVILTALNERRVYLAYQPIVPDVHAPCTKYECLIRMRGEDGQEIPAPAFIPTAERLGLVHLLDRRVLELATQALLIEPTIALNVNLSWETVKDPVWAEGYLSHLRANRRVCDRLTIELTETQAVDAIDASIEFVSAIKDFGCDFAIDDFGAGYTSFRNLKALDIDILKIDGSFVSGISSSRENQIIVRTLLDLARNFGMKTVAEWVDNESDATLLKALGVDYLQGFYLGKPEQRPEWSAPTRAEPEQQAWRTG
ncbi:bifunctional diguanylate cyclase/phosphodiesterase [Parvularcula sp. LCG005]|uniref:bifunctional diguanylate cyclase/phosphodiesterase n=1 Tax=Parvularcula sp. LCG005 TaxID=3078805 RepID=UPI0029426A98|nr:bifunctional diguanylate cyclase/phosphodiesterase [Parvularcula sp. LCG005]WOI52729.1 bifunctional diguanylate cyclase/phosphodiesterase [Parvularcula sp. LCG005]